ncbi:MAG: FmdB family transcriptional regulator [Actinobacteria bacterium]|nr:FmdB family transcriptional regulator [Actinomycetota bacterium]
MPAYDYKCVSCSSVFELTRALTDRSEITCPSCGGATKRRFTPVGVVFKGSGFHNTDYRARPASQEPSAGAKGSCEKPDSSAACAGCPAASSE